MARNNQIKEKSSERERNKKPNKKKRISVQRKKQINRITKHEIEPIRDNW